MSRLIDADALTISTAVPLDGKPYQYVHIDNIKAAPTVDAVPVVRCRECKNWANEWWCRKYPNFRVINPDWYCASGERKGGDE